MLFGRLLGLDLLPRSPLAVVRTGTVFPDCTAISAIDGGPIQIEFEYRSSNFWHHLDEWGALKRDNPTALWWVVCWLDDRIPKQHRITDLTVLPLHDLVREHDRHSDIPLILNWYEGNRDDAEALFRWRIAGLSDEVRRVIDRLRRFGNSEPEFRVRWPSKPDLPSFTVWSAAANIECFKINANGGISFPVSRWRLSPPQKTEILARLDQAVGQHWFAGREGKKKGRNVRSVLPDNVTVERFIDVWRALGNETSL